MKKETQQETQQEIIKLVTENKIKLDIAQFLLLKAELQMLNIKTKQRLQKLDDNNKELQKEIAEVKKTVDSAFKSALEAKDRIERARAKLDDARITLREARWNGLKEHTFTFNHEDFEQN